ncbi:MAG: oxygen-insensitive NAD(P)H nitroreductase [Micavibrio sp.]|nr:oxygen-insensitive NAD(P)H nitroreductase [Micavibrio sp.]
MSDMIVEAARQRYSTKKFDATKKISIDKLKAMKSLLQLCPSSVNSQPWYFIIAESAQAKDIFAKSAEEQAYNVPKIKDASHVVAFCSRTAFSEQYIERLAVQGEIDGRFADAEQRQGYIDTVKHYADLHREGQRDDLQEWMARQLYLNVGSFLLGVAALGLDAVPIEGFDSDVFDQQFSLTEKGLKSYALVAVGYRASDDFNAALPKSRLPEEEIITVL